MKKRLVTLLMAFTIAMGSLAPVSPVYAAEIVEAGESASGKAQVFSADAGLGASEGEKASSDGKESDVTEESPEGEASGSENPDKGNPGEDSSNKEKSDEVSGSDSLGNAGETSESGSKENTDNTSGSGSKDGGGNEDSADENSESGSNEDAGNENNGDENAGKINTDNDASDESSTDTDKELSGETDENTAGETIEDSKETSEENLDERDEDLAEESLEEISEASLIDETEEEDLVAAKTKFTDGYDTTGKTAASNGKLLTGWICAVEDTGAVLKIVATGSKALSCKEGNIYYIDPGTKRAARGTTVIGGKKYLFLESSNAALDCSLARGEGKARFVESGSKKYIVKANGEVYTGWFKASEIAPLDNKAVTNEFYLDPQTGAITVKAWVPRGKGITYVDENGLMMDTVKRPINDGIAYIEGDYYCFKGGLMTTGLVFFDRNGSVTTAAKADFARFFDQDNGTLRTGYFSNGGKYYYACEYEFYDWTKSGIDRRMDYGKIRLDDLDYCQALKRHIYIEKNGTLAVNKLITIDGDKFYAKEDGTLCKDEYMMINGKLCYFDQNSFMLDNSEEGAGRITGYYGYVDGAKYLLAKAVYIKNKSKNTTDGVAFFSDKACTNKLTDCWLVSADNATQAPDRREYYLDKNGNPVKGIVTVADKKYLFDTVTGHIMTFAYKNDTNAVDYRSVKVGGKLYLITRKGEVITKEGFYNRAHECYYVRKNGTVATGLMTLKTTVNEVVKEGGGFVQKPVTRNRKYYFYSDGRLFMDVILTMNNKLYVLNPELSGNVIPAEYFIWEKKDFDKYGDGGSVTNSDGSLFTGWKTIRGKRYFFEMSMPLTDDDADESEFYEINGKFYCFSPEGYALGGWVTLKNGDKYYFNAGDSESDASGVAKGEMKFYFDPKSYAMTTGFKTIDKKTYYFTQKNVGAGKFITGQMVCNDTLVIGGKTCSFDENGVLLGSLNNGRNQVKEGTAKFSYYVSPRTGARENSVIRKTGSKWFFYGSDGRQETELNIKNIDGAMTEAAFNKDGSIKGFFLNGVKQVNTMIGTDKGYYFLGAGGLPMTGLVSLPSDLSMDLTNRPGARVYVESDGYCSYSVAPKTHDYIPVKVGNKIYITDNALTVSENTSGYAIRNYGTLPEADRRMLSRYIETHEKYARNCASIYTSRSGSDLCVYVNSDGSLASGKTVVASDGKKVRLNKYGIPTDDIGMFVKDGSSWYLGCLSTVKSKGITGFTLDVTDSFGNKEYKAYVSFGADGKLRQIKDENGRPLNGITPINSMEAVIIKKSGGKETKETLKCNISGSVMLFKNGYPAGGKKTVKVSGMTAIYEVDPDTGWSCLKPAFKVN